MFQHIAVSKREAIDLITFCTPVVAPGLKGYHGIVEAEIGFSIIAVTGKLADVLQVLLTGIKEGTVVAGRAQLRRITMGKSFGIQVYKEKDEQDNSGKS